MPQFEIFSFSSQITWVFLFFSLIYSVFCYSFCPMIAAIFKTRKLQSYASYSLTDTSLDLAGSKRANFLNVLFSSKRSDLSKHLFSAISKCFISLNAFCYSNSSVRKFIFHNFF